MKKFTDIFIQRPLGALYAALLGFIAFFAALPMFSAGMYDAALVDLAMAVMLIMLVIKQVPIGWKIQSTRLEKAVAYLLLPAADVLALLPMQNLAGGLTTAFAFALIICAVVLYSSGTAAAITCAAPALWCCVFMPYHEEVMLLMSFPLRLSAAFLSANILDLAGVDIILNGTSLILANVDIAITDACSGIRQLDAFILIAFIAIQILHSKRLWKVLHLLFIIPSIILGNALRITLTVLFYKLWGETVFDNTWHTALGYTQIIFALLIFLAIGRIFTAADKKSEEDEV